MKRKGWQRALRREAFNLQVMCKEENISAKRCARDILMLTHPQREYELSEETERQACLAIIYRGLAKTRRVSLREHMRYMQRIASFGDYAGLPAYMLDA